MAFLKKDLGLDETETLSQIQELNGNLSAPYHGLMVASFPIHKVNEHSYLYFNILNH